VPEPLLTLLKFCFLALLYLFFLRVLRVVWAELRPSAEPAAVVTSDARASAAAGHLRVVEPAEHKGRTFPLAEELTVGRAAGCQVAIDDNYASQLHARIFKRDGRLYVEDLGSTNGTFLNRRKVSGPAQLRRGDRLQIGKTVLEVTR
jgi:pSer/pThr/pTyr-binding forkhead associated (FHA) protein